MDTGILGTTMVITATTKNIHSNMVHERQNNFGIFILVGVKQLMMFLWLKTPDSGPHRIPGGRNSTMNVGTSQNIQETPTVRITGGTVSFLK